MNSFQESKNELEAAIRYAENAISSAQATIESMEFRQEMAKKSYQEQTGREEALTKQVQELEERNDELNIQIVEQTNREATLEREVVKLRKEKEASSGPCGCQAYRDLEDKVATMPVIPKAVAIAIFREGMQHGVEAACSEIDNTNDIEINETGYTGGFEVNFTKYFDLSEHLDTDWMRDKVGNYSEEFVIDALGNLCADKEFECRIHGIDDAD